MRDNFQKHMVIKLKSDGLTFKQISEFLGLSLNSTQSLFYYNKICHKKKTGPKKKITKKDFLAIKRTISHKLEKSERITSPFLIKECNLNANVRTVQKHVKAMGYKYKKANKEIVLTQQHKENRIKMITSWIVNEFNFNKVVFSDEKRFCLDGPDDWRSYTPKSKNIIRPKRQCGGGGIMIWMMLMPNGMLAYTNIKGKFNSDAYIDLLKRMVVPIITLNFGSDIWLQEDNCMVHKSKKVASFKESIGLKILDWPSKSPDLNIVEDVWSMLSNKVYDGPSFRNNAELLKKLDTVIFDFNQNKRNILVGLYDQIRRRLCKVLELKGNLYNKHS